MLAHSFNIVKLPTKPKSNKSPLNPHIFLCCQFVPVCQFMPVKTGINQFFILTDINPVYAGILPTLVHSDPYESLGPTKKHGLFSFSMKHKKIQESRGLTKACHVVSVDNTSVLLNITKENTKPYPICIEIKTKHNLPDEAKLPTPGGKVTDLG